MSNKISLFLPLPRAWSVSDDLEASAEVVLERPSNGHFEAQILGTTLDDDLTLNTAAHQRRIGITTDAKLTLTLRRKKSTETEEIETIEFSAEGLKIGPIALGQTRKVAEEEPELDILLHGSLVFPLANLSEEGQQNWLKSLWPTGDPSAVTHLRIEPDGLYLQGILPGALFADATDRTDRPVALRVPQLASDFVAKVQDEDADRRHEGRFWSLTSFRFPGLQTDSRAFVQEHAERFRAFRLLTDGGADPSAPRRSDTFIDNLVATPPPECVVRIFSNGDALEWDARPPGVRLVIAAGRSDETTFFPRALTGRAVRDNSGRFARDINRPVQFESGVFDPDPPKLPIRLEASNRGGARQVDFQFPAETLVALSVPIVPPSPPGGPPPLPEQAGDLDPDAPREPVRNWICTRDGWLQLDAERPVSPPTPGLPERDVSGVLPLDTLSGALLRALDPKAGDEAAAGFEVRTEALAAGHIAIALDLADGAESLRLDLRGARTTVLTPRVWFAPRTGPGPDTPREAVPSLTAAALSEATRADDLDLYQESDGQRKARAKRLQERLDEVLQPATFVTFVARAPGPIGDDELHVQHARRLYAVISWDAENLQFRFGFPADRLVAWQRPSLPLVTNYPLTPPSDRDAYLDSNRGLIPFVRKEQSDGSRPLLIDVGFPAGALPRLVADGDVPPPDFPRRVDDGWKPARETRVFLPTLPGLEADVDEGLTDWAYRHAVPALDEAYAEAREGDDGPAVVTPIGLDQDLARVEGTVAFTVGAAGTDGASGWLPVGTAPISDVKPEELATANPRLSFQLGGPGSEHRINFDRRSGVAALSANLSYEFTDSSRPAFSALALSPNPAAQARDEAIIHNGQPMLTRWSSVLNAVVTLDGDGLVRAEPTGPDQLAWPPGANEPIVRRTVSLTLLVPRGENMPNGEHILDLVGVSVGRAPEPDDLGLERWTWTEGEEKTWPSLLGFQLYPLQLVSLANDGTVVLRAVLLPRPPEKSADPLHAPSFAKGSLLLTFKPTDQLNKLELAEVAGDMDWRFPTPLSAPESEPRVERLVARVSLDAGGDSLTLAIREVAVRHEVGLLRLVPGVSASQEASIVVDPALGPMLQARLKDAVERPSDGARLEYVMELNITPSDAGEAPPQAPIWGEYLFRWSSNLPKMDGTEGPLAWELSNAAPSSVDEGGPPAADPGDPPTRWQLRFLRSTQDLVGVLGVEPHRISARDMLFQVKALRPSPDVDDKSWFQTTPLHRGFAAVTFTPSGGPATVPLPAVFAAEIPLSFVGQTADRTIQVYDPSDDTLHTWDRGTESITLGRDGLPLKRDGLPLKEEAIRFANASLVGTSQDEIVFARSGEPGQLVSISLPRNVTTSKPFAAGVTTRALTVMRLNQRNIAVAVDDAEDVRAWDLTDNSPPRPTGPGPTIEKPLGENVAGSHVSAIGWAPDGDVNVVAWARKSADGSDAWVYVWDRQNNRQAQDVGTGPADTLRRINPHIEGLSPETAPPKWPQSKASPIKAITVSNNGELLISGAQDGSLLVWKHDVKPTELPVVLQKMIHLPPSSPITALTSLIFGDDRIISADEAGMLRVWPNPQNTNPTPPLDQIPTVVAENEIPHGAAVAALVPLGLDGKRTQFAVLDRDGTVTLYKVLRGTATSPEDTVFQRERLDTRGASIRSIAALPISDSRIKLLLDGVAAPSRLEGVLRAGTAGLSIEVSGRLTAQDAIDYEDLSVSGARCTHRADLVFDRARVPLESLFRGAGPPQPLSLGAMVEHTFRFPLGPERVWQTPQVVRLMRAEDFANAYAVNHPGGDDLVIDAGAVHWLQWVDKADREPGGAASVSNESLRILLRPREVGRMQRGAPRVVRLPTVLQRAPLDPPMGLVLKVPAASEASLGALTLEAETSGAQPLQPPPDSLTIGIVDPPLDPRAAQDDSVSYFDRGAEAAWLDERFLHGLLIPRRSPAPGLPQPPTGPVSPILNNTNVILDSSGDLGDLAWLRLTKRPSHLPEGAEDLRSLGPISLRQLQPQLAAATVANKHRPGGPESPAVARLDGPTLAEFPFVVEASGAGASGTSSPFQDVQLVVFEGGDSGDWSGCSSPPVPTT